jgi:hypothetical protein
MSFNKMDRSAAVAKWTVPALLTGTLLLGISGCGLPASPQPPSLNLPEPVIDLAASRAGNIVHLHWTMPRRTTDKVLLKGDQPVHICRRVEKNGPCEAAGDIQAAPRAEADFDDHLPPALTSGPPHLLEYYVELKNRHGRDAGPSNIAYTAAGADLPQVTALHGAAQIEGVALQWTPEPGGDVIRLKRVLVEAPKEKKSGKPDSSVTSAPATPQEQTLEVATPDRGGVLDRDAALDHTYRYTVQRVSKLTLDGHAFEVLSMPSETITINAKDIFPPRVPTELQAVADPDAHAIDLSWAPNTEADLAGYVVYRRDAGTDIPPVKISSSSVTAPSFRDPNPQPGQRYRYSISAIDRNGNESTRSTEVEEALPQQ